MFGSSPLQSVMCIPGQKTLCCLRFVGKALACQINLTLLDTFENIVYSHR